MNRKLIHIFHKDPMKKLRFELTNLEVVPKRDKEVKKNY